MGLSGGKAKGGGRQSHGKQLCFTRPEGFCRSLCDVLWGVEL